MIERRVSLGEQRASRPYDQDKQSLARWRRRMVDGDPLSKEQIELARINSKLALGELTAEQALAEAAQGGFMLDKLTDASFDPLACNYWTPLQAIVWIATHSVEGVREVSVEARARTVSWHEIEDSPRRRVLDPGIALEGGMAVPSRLNRPPQDRLTPRSVLRLKNHAHIDGMLGNAGIIGARDELLRHLSDRSIVANAIVAETAPREDIDPSQWVDLRFFRDDIAYRGDVFRVHSFVYFSIRLDRTRVISLWPEVEGAGHFDSAELMKLSDAAEMLRINPDTLRKRAERKHVKKKTGQGTYVPRWWVSKQPEFKDRS